MYSTHIFDDGTTILQWDTIDNPRTLKDILDAVNLEFPGIPPEKIKIEADSFDQFDEGADVLLIKISNRQQT